MFSGKRCLMAQGKWFSEEGDIDLKPAWEKFE